MQIAEPSRPELPLAWPEDPRLVAAEVASLAPERRLARAGDLEVLEAGASEIPLVLLEIGRRREAQARAGGRGSGSPRALERFDREARHLFVWSAKRRELVAACRLARTDELLLRSGPEALASSLYFEHVPELLARLGPCLEVGALLAPRAERARARALALLCRGLGALVAREPRYHRLLATITLEPELEPELARDARRMARLGRLLGARVLGLAPDLERRGALTALVLVELEPERGAPGAPRAA